VLAPTCAHRFARLPDGSCALCEQPPLVDTPRARATLTTGQRIAIARAADAELMRRSLSLFVQRSWHVLEPDTPLEWNWHHDALCDHVQAVLEDWIKKKADLFGFTQRIRNLVINLPPGTAKSRILMVHAVAWMWLRCASWKVLCISSNPENVTRDAELCRELVGSKWYRETFDVKWTIRDDIDSKKKYKLTAGGERLSRGLIAKFTGVRADAIFFDDPDDAHDVFSEASRKERASKWENAIYNRVNDKRSSVRIGLQQRVHEDDWSAQVLRQGTWAHLNIPMEFDPEHECECGTCARGREAPLAVGPRADGDDRVGTPIGWSDPRGAPGWSGSMVMHAARFPDEDLAEERVRLGTYGYECQYNQRPASLEGGMFRRGSLRWFAVADEQAGYDHPRPEGCNQLVEATVLTRGAGGALYLDGEPLDAVALSCDASHGSVEESASRTSFLVVGIKGALRFVLHDSTRLRTFTQTRDDLVLLRAQFRCTHVLVENKANGRPVIEVLQDEVEGLIPIEVPGSKESRASAMMPALDAGQVLLRDGASWVDEFVAELCIFNHGKHDDRVDALSQLMTYFRAHAAPLKKWRAIAAAASSIRVDPERHRKYW
jgi:predicted phage terminase large subunit-like protein